MTVYFSYGNNPSIAPICSVASGGSVSTNYAGQYTVVYCFKGLGGFSDFSPVASFNLSANDKVTITIPSNAFKLAEIWHSVILFIKKGTGNYYPVYEKFLFDPSNPIEWDTATRLSDVVITLDRDTHLNNNIIITDINAVNLSDYHNGKLVKINNSFYTLYKAPYLKFNTQTLVRSDNQAAFAYTPYGELNPYATGMQADEPLSSIFSAPMYQRPVLYDPVYNGDGSAGFPQYFILRNEADQDIPSGTRVLFGFFVNSEDYSSEFASLYYCKNLGFVRLNDFSYDPTDGASSANMPDLGIERRCLDQSSNFTLNRQLPPNYGVLLQVYPKFHKYQLPVTVPTFYDLQIEPYFLLNLSQYTELGAIFGDFILDQYHKRVIIPDLVSAVIKTGSGMVKSYYFQRASESILPPLVYANNTSYVYIDINGTPIPYGTQPTTIERESLALRAIIKNVSGFTNPIAVGNFSNWGDTFSFNFTAPTTIRDSYPVIGGESVRYSGKFAVIVTRNNEWKYQIYDGLYTDSNSSFTFDFNNVTAINSLADLNIHTDPLFGFYDIQNCFSDFTASAGTNTYQIYVAEYYDGAQPSSIDHRESSGCIPVLTGTLQSLLAAVSHIYPPVETVADLRALGSNTAPIQQYQQRLVLRPKPAYYVFYGDLTNEDDGYLFVKPDYVTGAGRWRRIAHETARGYAHLYKATNGNVAAGQIKLNQIDNKLYIHKTTAEAINATEWLSYIGKETHILVHNPYDFRELCHFVVVSSEINQNVFEFIYNPDKSYLVDANTLFQNNNQVYVSCDLRYYETPFSWHTVRLSNTFSNGTFTISPTNTYDVYDISISNISVQGTNNNAYLELGQTQNTKVFFRNTRTNQISLYEKTGYYSYRSLYNSIDTTSNLGDIYEIYIMPPSERYTETIFLFKYTSNQSISTGQLNINFNYYTIKFSKTAHISLNANATVLVSPNYFTNGDVVELQSNNWYLRGIIYDLDTSNNTFIIAKLINLASRGAGPYSEVIFRNLGAFTDKTNYLGVVGTHFNNGVISGAIHGEYSTIFTSNNALAKFEHNGQVYIAEKTGSNITIRQNQDPFDTLPNPTTSYILLSPRNVRRVYKIKFSSTPVTFTSNTEVVFYQDNNSHIWKTGMLILVNGIYTISNTNLVFKVVEPIATNTYKIEWLQTNATYSDQIIYEDVSLAGYSVYVDTSGGGGSGSGGSGGSGGGNSGTSDLELVEELQYEYTSSTTPTQNNFTINVGYIEKKIVNDALSFAFSYVYFGSSPTNKPNTYNLVSTLADYPVMQVKIEYTGGYLVGLIDAPAKFSAGGKFDGTTCRDYITYDYVSNNNKNTNYTKANITSLKAIRVTGGQKTLYGNEIVQIHPDTFVKAPTGHRIRVADSNNNYTPWSTEVLDYNDLSGLSNIAEIEVEDQHNYVRYGVRNNSWRCYVYIYHRSDLQAKNKEFYLNDPFEAFSQDVNYEYDSVSQIKILESVNWPPPDNTLCTLKFYKYKEGGFIRGFHCIKQGYGYVTLDYNQVWKSKLSYLWSFREVNDGWSTEYPDYYRAPIWEVTLDFPVSNIQIPCYLKPLECMIVDTAFSSISALVSSSYYNVPDNRYAIYKPYMGSKDYLCIILPKYISNRDSTYYNYLEFLQLMQSNSFYINVNGTAPRDSILCREDYTDDLVWISWINLDYGGNTIWNKQAVVTSNLRAFRPKVDRFCLLAPPHDRFKDYTKYLYYGSSNSTTPSNVDKGEIYIQYDSGASILTLTLHGQSYLRQYIPLASGNKIRFTMIRFDDNYVYTNIYTLATVTYNSPKYTITANGWFYSGSDNPTYSWGLNKYAYLIEILG